MIYNVIGYMGAVLYLLGYFLVATKRIKGSSKTFHIFNLFGAVGVSTAAFYNHDNPSAILNVAWGGIALVTLIFSSRAKKK